jgi:hypothetical protein
MTRINCLTFLGAMGHNVARGTLSKRPFAILLRCKADDTSRGPISLGADAGKRPAFANAVTWNKVTAAVKSSSFYSI